jgi:NitT/TauT family transport system permease protein
MGVWQLAVNILNVPALILPSPYRVLTEAMRNFAELSGATLLTAAAALTGFACSTVLGTLIAMIFSQSRLIRISCYPYAIFLQTVPIVAVAPIIVIWMGEGFPAVVVITVMISLFPLITNGTEGMTKVPEGLQELFALNRASRWQTLRKLQLPGAAPHLVAGAKIASGAAVLGAIVGEFFVGVGVENPGLGFLIAVAKDRFNMAFLFAAVMASTLLGIAMFGVVSFLGDKVLLSWMERRIHERNS